MNGAPWRGAYPVIVEFKARREKEQLLWRSKDRLRKINIVVTDDIAFRQKEEWINQTGEEQSSTKPQNPASPKKQKKSKLTRAMSPWKPASGPTEATSCKVFNDI